MKSLLSKHNYHLALLAASPLSKSCEARYITPATTSAFLLAAANKDNSSIMKTRSSSSSSSQRETLPAKKKASTKPKSQATKKPSKAVISSKKNKTTLTSSKWYTVFTKGDEEYDQYMATEWGFEKVSISRFLENGIPLANFLLLLSFTTREATFHCLKRFPWKVLNRAFPGSQSCGNAMPIDESFIILIFTR